MDPADTIRVRQMSAAAHEAVGFAAGRQRADLDQDRMLVLAVVKQSTMAFLEPNLQFAVIDSDESHVTIRIFFEQESRPPWDPSRFGLTDTDVAAIDLHLSVDDLRQAAADLRQQLQRFPIRVGRKAPT